MQYPKVPKGVSLKSGGVKIPAYQCVEQALRKDIEQFRWQPDDLIPPEPQLAAAHGVSIGTVRKALHNLVISGLLYRIQGKGTYVAGSFVRCEKLRFYRTHAAFHVSEEQMPLAHFISCGNIAALPVANAALGIDSSAPLIHLVRCMHLQGAPLVLIHSYFEAARFPHLVEEEAARFEKFALTLIIENDYKTPTMATHELTSAVAADAATAVQLGVLEHTPVLLIEMLSFTYNNNPYEYRQSYCVSDRKFFREY